MVEKVYSRREVRRFYGDPANSTFYYRIKTGLIPAPDVALGPDTPGWTEGLITRHQKTLLAAAEHDRKRRSQRLQTARRGEPAGTVGRPRLQPPTTA